VPDPEEVKVSAARHVGELLATWAAEQPDALAVAEPSGRWAGRGGWRSLTFRELDEDSDRIAAALRDWGVQPGMRLVLLVRPGIDFVALVFALLKAGVVMVLIDPGMGRRHLLRCLKECHPEGFVAIRRVQLVRWLLGRHFPQARWNVTVGPRWWGGGMTLAQLRQRASLAQWHPPAVQGESPAAIIFTSGSTGPPKGVLYTHGNFLHQVLAIRDHYRITPGEVDLATFPLFGLFNAAMGVSTVFPRMDFTRPAMVDPREIVQAVRRFGCTQAFGSPALWNVVGRYCEAHGERLSTLKRVFSAGAPVPPHVLRRMLAVMAPGGEAYTPYGATEALPVASISAREVLEETAPQTTAGQGTCVGRRFAGIQWQVVRITDDPIATLDEMQPLPEGEIGELVVRGPVVTRQYVTRVECNALHKVADGEAVWHRMGDVGYLESTAGGQRFWYCGRKAHRVVTEHGTLYTEPCEAIFQQHPWVYRAALVGVGPSGRQRPVVFVEPWPEHWGAARGQWSKLQSELQALAAAHPHTASIHTFLLRRALPVDIRHNAKIFREKLAQEAARLLGVPAPQAP
jgi:acyl-CoA synthetase (AMP-forming)/AMP-acid ligase II